jgi:Carboxypeptidase regulatory-like domain
MGKRWSRFLERLPKVQLVVGLTAGLASISGAVYSVVSPSKSAPVMGEVVTVVRENRSNRPIKDATVEILTAKDAVVTRLTSRPAGRARIPLKEGNYRLRVSHPTLGRDIRQIHVLAGQTSEIHVALGPASSPVAARPRTPGVANTGSRPSSQNAVSRGVDNVKRFFRDLTR